MPVITTSLLTKRFGTTIAAHTISIQVEEGEIYGFLGLNGAGKTTLIRMLLGMIKPDSGTILLFNKQLTPRFDQWNDIGYLVETPYAYPTLTVYENLKVYYHLRQIKDTSLIDRVMDQLKLSRYRNTQAKVLSLGNQQRLGLAKAFMHRPRLLILDEPTNGLDPEGIVEVRELLKNLAQQGTTIFVSSHILGEIAKIASRIGIIHEGRLIKELTLAELNHQLLRKLLLITPDNTLALQQLKEGGYAARLRENDEIELTDIHALAHPEQIATFLVEKNLPPKQLYQFTEDLEMFFLRTIRNT